MHRIIVSDIFGKTKSLEKISDSLSGTVEIFDPYDSVSMNFKTEQEAYAHFSSEVGLEKYTEKLKEYLLNLKKPVSLLGFSVGASAIWKLSAEQEIVNVLGSVCFYSSQIRHYREIVPQFPVQLVFPSDENSFSITELIEQLKKNKRVKIHQAPYLHGFMNFHSPNFTPYAYALYLRALCNVPCNTCIQMSEFFRISDFSKRFVSG